MCVYSQKCLQLGAAAAPGRRMVQLPSVLPRRQQARPTPDSTPNYYSRTGYIHYTTCCSMGGCDRTCALAAAFALHALDMWTRGSVPEFLVGLDDLDWQFGPAFAYSVRIVLPCSGYILKLGIFTSNNLASVLYTYAWLLLSDSLLSWILLLLRCNVIHAFCTPFFQFQSTVLLL